MSLTRFLLAWRTIPLHDREVVDGLVDPAHAGPSAPLAAALAAWPGSYYWSDEADGRHVVLTRKTASIPRESWGLHAMLALITVYLMTLAGGIFAGAVSPEVGLGISALASGRDGFASDWATGLSFSLPLFAILFCHEMGHYLTARRYQLDVSPPYFLPGPPPVPPLPGIGTFGAFIRLRTLLTDRRQLLDVGTAGPFAGFVVALPVFTVGLTMSRQVPADTSGMVLVVGGIPWMSLGDSVITLLLRAVTGSGGADALVLHPMAFAGWMGMFVTMLNLLPMGQLDGGHILFAAVPGWYRRIAFGFWVGVMVLGLFWSWWLLWGVIVLLLSRGRFVHPPVLDVYRPLPKSRRWLAWGSLVLLLLTFAPVPFRS